MYGEDFKQKHIIARYHDFDVERQEKVKNKYGFSQYMDHNIACNEQILTDIKILDLQQAILLPTYFQIPAALPIDVSHFLN